MKAGISSFRSTSSICTPKRRSSLLMLAVMPAAALLVQQAHAGTDTWSGGTSGSWSNSANWDHLPVAGDTLIFTTSNNTITTDDFTAGTLFNGITFDASAGNFTLGGTNGLTLGVQPYTGAFDNTYAFSTTWYNALVNNAAGLQTVTTPITLSTLSATAPTGGQHIIAGGPGGIALNGTFTRTFSSTVDFTGTVTTTTIANDPNTGMIGPWATYGQTDFAAVNSGTISAYTGYTVVNAGGILPAASPNAVVKWTGGAISGPAQLLTDINSMDILTSGTTSGATLAIASGNTLRLGATGAILRGDATTSNTIAGFTIGSAGSILTAGGATNQPGELILNVNNTTSNVTNQQSIDSVTITSNITNNGSGTVSLVKTGIGSLKLNGNNTFTGNIYINEGTIRNSATGGFSTGNGTIYVADGSQAYIVSAITGTNTVFNPIFIAGVGRQEALAANTFVGGAIRIATAGSTWAGPITMTADARITARGNSGAGGLLTGKISGAYKLELNGAGSGNLTISNTANDWSGGLVIGSSISKLGASEVIPNGVGKGNLFFDTDGTAPSGGSQGTNSTLDLNGFNETVNGMTTTGSFVGGSTGVIANTGAGNATLTVGDNNASGSFVGNFVDTTTKTIALTKIGTGTETLNTNANYHGNTTVTGGTLQLSNSGFINNSSHIIVGPAGTLDASGVGGLFLNSGQTVINNGGNIAGPITAGTGTFVSGSQYGSNLTLQGGSINPGATELAGVVGTTAFGDLVISSGFENVDATGAGDKFTGANVNISALTVNVNANPTPGTYTIISATALTGANNVSLSTNNAGGITFALDTTTANTVKLIVTGATLNLSWNNLGGTGDGSTWDTNQQNWKNGATSTVYIDGANVAFNDTNNFNYTVNISGTVNPGNVTVSNNSGDYVLNGNIGGQGSLTKSGTRALTLNGSNTYSGGTFLNVGTLNINNNNALGTAALSIAANTTIDNTSGSSIDFSGSTNNPLNIAGNFTFTGAADASHDINFGTGLTTVTANTTITVSGAGSTLTIGGGIVGGANSINKAGPGTLVLNGANSFSGGTNITGGTVRAGNVGSLGSGTITVNTGGSLFIPGSPTNPIILAGGTLYPAGGTVTFGGDITLATGTTSTFLAGDPTTSIIGNGNLTGILHGSGTLIVGQPSTYTGTADAGDGFRLVAAAATSDFTGNIIVNNNSKFELQSLAAGAFNVGGTGTISLTPGTISTTGDLTGTYPEFNVRDSGTGNTSFSNNVVILPGAGTVEINALGTAAPTGSFITLGNLKIADQQGVMTYLATTQTAKVLQFSSVTMAGGNITFMPKPALVGTVTPGSLGADIEIDNVGETAQSNIIVNGLRTLMLGGTDTFTGNIALQQGTIQLRSSTALSTIHPTVTFGDSATATGTFDLNGFNGVVGGLAINPINTSPATSNIITNSAASTTATLTFSTGTSTFGGTIQNGAGITALSVTSGSLTLSNPATYTGTTNVNAGGTLTIASTSSLNAATSLTTNGTTNFANASQSIAGLNSSTGGTVNLNTTVLTVTTGGSYVGSISDGGTGGGLIVPVASVLTTGPINANSLEVDGKQAFTNTTIRTLSKVNTLTVAGSAGAWTGALDLTSSRLVVEDSSINRAADLANYKDMVANNAGGTVGIFSSTAAGNGQVVVVSDNAVRLATFGPAASNFGTGVGNVDANSILITEAVPGDANLDGVVDLKDLQVLAIHWQQPATDWSQTDFDGNGIVALPDLQALAIHWQNGVGSAGQGSGESFSQALSQISLGGTSSVPEPMSLAILGLGGVVLASRRRHK